MRVNILGLRFTSWPLMIALLAASGCGGTSPINNEPPEVAALRDTGKKPWEIRAELKAREVKKMLKDSPLAGRRTH